MNTIKEILSNPVFQFTGTVCSILGAIIGILAIIPKTRTMFFSYKQNINVKEQNIQGSENEQSGGNISNKNFLTSRTAYRSKIAVEKQTIVGDKNKQAGGDING
jgi:hypothetical protein